MERLGESRDYSLSQLARKLNNLVRWGIVRQVDLTAARVKVEYARDEQEGPVLTGWVPWLPDAAGAVRSWRPPSLGEQVMLLSPDGDLAQSVALGSLYQDDYRAPSSNPDLHRIQYSDGAVVEYDRSEHKLTATLPAGGKAEITAPGGLTVTGDVKIEGDLRVEGDETVTGDVDAENVTATADVSDRNGDMQEMRTAYNSHTHGPMGVQPRMM